MKFVTMATALVAVTMSLSSCWRADDAVELPTEVTDVAPELYSVVASANAEATFTIDVEATKKDALDKKSALFTEIDRENQTVKVTATLVNPAGFVESTQTATVNFSGSMRSAVIAFDFAKASTDTKTQAEVAAATEDLVVTSNTTPIVADMTIPAGVEVSGNVTDPFSVTAYKSTPSIVDADDVEVGKPLTTSDEESKVMVLSCTPSGATFSEPITLKVFVGTELAGETIEVENNGEKLTGVVGIDGNVEFKVSHFSEWNMLFIPIVAKIDKGSITIANQSGVAVSRGENTYTFTKYAGVKNYSTTGLLGMFINTMFGESETTLDDEGSFMATDSGTATIKVVQNYTDYTFRYGLFTVFSARVWGGTVSTIDIVGGGSGSNVHSGGSGF